MEFSRSQGGNEVLSYQGFEYLYFRNNNGVLTWRCRQNRAMKCHANIKTHNNTIVRPPMDHCHDACCPQKVEANLARSLMKQAMKSAVSATPRNVMGSVLSHVSSDVLAHVPKQSSLSRTLLRHRKDGNVPNPGTINFVIPDKYTDFVLHDSGVNDPDRILILGDFELLNELNKDTIYGDGTFDKVPTMFCQLYTWHAKVGNAYPPCLYVLLQKKTMGTYNRMFDIMKSLLPNSAPQKVLVDFEKACMNAVRIAFPNAEVKGCYFHLCQSLVRKVNSVELKAEFQSDIEMRLKLKSLAALTFVPVDDVRNVFAQLAATFPNAESYNEILTYFFSTYIEGAAGRDPQFPIRLWNHHDAAFQQCPKTKNCCERFHNALNSLFHCSHPSIWFLFDGLQRDLSIHRLTLVNTQAGHVEV